MLSVSLGFWVGVGVGVAQHLLMTTFICSEGVLRLTSTTTASSEDKLWLLGRSIVPFVSRTVTWNDPEPVKTSVMMSYLEMDEKRKKEIYK